MGGARQAGVKTADAELDGVQEGRIIGPADDVAFGRLSDGTVDERVVLLCCHDQVGRPDDAVLVDLVIVDEGAAGCFRVADPTATAKLHRHPGFAVQQGIVEDAAGPLHGPDQFDQLGGRGFSGGRIGSLQGLVGNRRNGDGAQDAVAVLRCLGASAGTLLGSAAGAIVNATLPPEAVMAYGWRIPFVVGLVGAAIATVLLWNHDTSSFGVVVADNFGLFVTGILIVVGLLSLAFDFPVTITTWRGGGVWVATLRGLVRIREGRIEAITLNGAAQPPVADALALGSSVMTRVMVPRTRPASEFQET